MRISNIVKKADKMLNIIIYMKVFSVSFLVNLGLPAVIPWLWFCSKSVHTSKALVEASRQLAVVSSFPILLILGIFLCFPSLKGEDPKFVR